MEGATLNRIHLLAALTAWKEGGAAHPAPCPLPPLLPHAILTSCLFLPPDRRLLDQAWGKPGALFFHSFPPSELEDRQLQQQPLSDGLQHLGQQRKAIP